MQHEENQSKFPSKISETKQNFLPFRLEQSTTYVCDFVHRFNSCRWLYPVDGGEARCCFRYLQCLIFIARGGSNGCGCSHQLGRFGGPPVKRYNV